MSLTSALRAQRLSEDEDMHVVALSYVSDAFEEARLDGLDEDAMVQAAIFTAFKELVATYGEEATARYAETLEQRVRAGEFTAHQTRQ